MRIFLIIGVLLSCLVFACSKTTTPTNDDSGDDGGSTTHPTGNFIGRVVQSGTNNTVFIEGAVVALAQKSDITDELGQYWIEYIPTGSYTVTIVKSGYQTVTELVTIYENKNNGKFYEMEKSK